MTDRSDEIMIARVLIGESRRRGRQPFAFTLLEWAANHRRRAMRVGTLAENPMERVRLTAPPVSRAPDYF